MQLPTIKHIEKEVIFKDIKEVNINGQDLYKATIRNSLIEACNFIDSKMAN